MSGRIFDNLQSNKKFPESQYIVDNLCRIKKAFIQPKIIISFREHSAFLSSLYSQYIHEGGVLDEDEFIQRLDKEKISYRKALTLITEEFKGNYFAYNYTQYLKEPEKVIRKILEFMQIGDNKELMINTKKYYNKSLNRKRLMLLKKINKVSKSKMNPKGLLPLNNKYLKRFRLSPRQILQRFPYKNYGEKFSMNEKLLKQLKDYYKDDWAFITKKLCEKK